MRCRGAAGLTSDPVRLSVAAGTWLLIYTGEYVADDDEVEEREAAAREKYGRVCYTWTIQKGQLPLKCLITAVQNGAYHRALREVQCSGRGVIACHPVSE